MDSGIYKLQCRANEMRLLRLDQIRAAKQTDEGSPVIEMGRCIGIRSRAANLASVVRLGVATVALFAATGLETFLL